MSNTLQSFMVVAAFALGGCSTLSAVAKDVPVCNAGTVGKGVWCNCSSGYVGKGLVEQKIQPATTGVTPVK